MGKLPKIHFRLDQTSYGWTSVCGDPTPRFTTADVDKITCKRCRRKLQKREDRIAEAIIQAVELEDQDPGPLRDPESGLPILTRSTYQNRACKCGGRHCHVCKHFKKLQADHEVAPWQERTPWHQMKRYRWPSVSAALDWYAMSIQEGYPQLSLSEALLRVGKVGLVVQGGDSGDSRAIQNADDRSTIAKALQAAPEPGYPMGKIAPILLVAAGVESTDMDVMSCALGIEQTVLRKLVKRARGRVRRELERMDAIPPPTVRLVSA